MPRAGVTRDAVIATAISIADADGLPNLTLGAVAGKLGVSVPSLYKHVDNLADVRRGIGLVAAGRLRDELIRPTLGRSGRDALEAMSAAYRNWATANRGQYEALQAAPAPDDDDAMAAAAELVGTISAVLGGYGLDGDDQIDAIRFLRAVLHGFVQLVAAGGFRLERDLQVSFDRMIGGLDLTFRSWGQGSR